MKKLAIMMALCVLFAGCAEQHVSPESAEAPPSVTASPSPSVETSPSPEPPMSYEEYFSEAREWEYRFNTNMYDYAIRDGNKIVIIYKDMSEEVLYEDADEGEITAVVGSPNVAFYLKGDELYRVYFPTGRVDVLGTLAGVTQINPISNIELLWGQYDENLDTEEHMASFYSNFSTGEIMTASEFINWVGEMAIHKVFAGDDYNYSSRTYKYYTLIGESK